MGEREKLAHMLRRATFGPTAEEVDAAEQMGYLATIARLTGPSGPSLGPKLPVLPPDPTYALHYTATQAQKEASYKARHRQQHSIIEWWLDKMVANGHQTEEKLTFFWHGHWATGMEKVASAPLMLLQHNVFRVHGRGDFANLVKAMLRDPALIMWLDNQRNTRLAPNENLARELMELFTLGVGNYSETDVKAGARALTGWTVDRVAGTSRLDAKGFDQGEKTILKHTARFDADSLADLLIRQPSSARFVVGRLWFRFVSGDPVPEEAMQRLASAYSASRSISALVAALLQDPAFEKARGQLVKQPIEWLIGAMRQLRLRPSQLSEPDRRQLVSYLEQLEQVPFRPPSVGGWPTGITWLTSHSAQVRLRLADMLAARASEETLARISEVPSRGRSRALARMLVVDSWTDRTSAVLDEAADDVRKLLALGLIAPEYCIH